MIVVEMGSARGAARSVIISAIVAACGFPRPADIGSDDASPAGPTYQVTAVSPSIATTGDTITLEGTFAASATIAFPGGAMQSATVLGEHRATVVVPDAATAGDVTVSTGGVTVGPALFRRTAFTLGLQPFRVSYEQVDGARQSPTLRIARTSTTAAVVANWLYVVGGADGGGPLNSVERAATNADGTLGSFDIASDTGLVEGRAGHTSLVIGSALYVIGGSGTGGALSSVERATIRADGSLGTFTVVPGTALVTARSGHSSLVVGNAVYVIGGTRGDGMKLGSVERAVIQADGSLGMFSVVDAALAIPRSDHTTELIGNALYVIGGDAGGGAPSGSVERTVISGDGSLGAFSTAPGAALTLPRSGHRTAVLGGALYVLGGAGSAGVTTGVERAPIGVDGALAPFAGASGTTLSVARTGHAIAMVGNMLYAIGGRSTAGPIQSIERASLDADSALASFADSEITLVLPREHHTSTAIRDGIYVIGRSGAENALEQASLRPDGGLTRFSTVSGISLVTNRSSHTVAVAGNSLYVIGGAGDQTLSSVERAVVNTDGSLGPFSLTPVTLQEARFGHVSVILGNFLYVISGVGINHTRLTSIERTTINNDGTLGAFATVSGTALNTGRNYSTAVVTDQYLYIIGGLDDVNGGTSSVERAPIGAGGSLGAFVAVPSVVEARGAQTGTVVGNGLYIIGGLTAAGHVKSIERAIVNADGSLSVFGVVSSLAAARARHTAVLAGNFLYLVGGETELLNGDTTAALEVGYAGLR